MSQYDPVATAPGSVFVPTEPSAVAPDTGFNFRLKQVSPHPHWFSGRKKRVLFVNSRIVPPSSPS